MLLNQLRQHLLRELHDFPDIPHTESVSYAITTAALARNLLDYLNVQDLTLPAATYSKEGESTYGLSTVLNRILHFHMLTKQPGSIPYPDVVILYSDRGLLYRDRLYFRLAHYKGILHQLATNDILIGRYLLRQTVTLLTTSGKAQVPKSYYVEMKQRDLLRTVNSLVMDSWGLVRELADAGQVEVAESPNDCYEESDTGEATPYHRFQNWREFFFGHMKAWMFAGYFALQNQRQWN